jgi:hypothetical protein
MAVAMRGESPCTPTRAPSTPARGWPDSLTSTTLPDQSRAPLCAGANAGGRIILGHTEIGFYDRYMWPTRAATTLAVGDWIGRVYNRRRRPSALGMIRPVEYENRFIQTAQGASPCVRQTGSRPGGQLGGDGRGGASRRCFRRRVGGPALERGRCSRPCRNRVVRRMPRRRR